MKRIIQIVIILTVAITVCAFVNGYTNSRKDIHNTQPSVGQTQANAGMESVQPLPETGVLHKSFYKGVAPFGVTTQSPGPNCYFKLISISDQSPVLTAFVRAGEELSLKIPLGTYKVQYALGSTWYGEEALFGQDASRLASMNPLEFKQTSEGYFGHTIEWALQSPRDVDILESSEAEF